MVGRFLEMDRIRDSLSSALIYSSLVSRRELSFWRGGETTTFVATPFPDATTTLVISYNSDDDFTNSTVVMTKDGSCFAFLVEGYRSRFRSR
jgi:hypothetical protein